MRLEERARLGIPKLDTRVEADVREARGMTPFRDGADGPPRWRPKQSHLAQRPGREKRKTRGHSCTSYTEQHQVLRSFKRCAHTQGGTHKTAQRETPTCARCSCLLVKGGSSGTQRACVLVLRPWSPVVPVDLHSLAAYRCFFFSGGAHLLLRRQAGIRNSLDGYVMNLVEHLVPEEMLSSDLDDVASLLRDSLVKLTSLGW